MELVADIKMNQSVPMRKRVFVEFKDKDGKIKKGELKSNDGLTCIVLVGSVRKRMSRKEIKFIKE